MNRLKRALSAPSSLLVALVTFAAAAQAQQSCSTASYPAPSLADGYVARLVTSNLRTPRGIKFDSNGALLVVEADHGVTALTLDYAKDGCITVSSKNTVVDDSSLNHGIEVSANGKYLYASSSEAAYRWQYNAQDQSVGDQETLVTNMTNSDHTTRTLLLSRYAPEMLVVSRGSTSNIDPLAERKSTGHAQIKAFNLSSMNGPYDFVSQGTLLAWGVRNDVGVDEDPASGKVYSVENSVDEMMRNGEDIHDTNPAEELNFIGYLNGTESSNEGRNFGYPECYTAWDVGTIPDFDGKVGEQFAIGQVGSNNSDSMCSASNRQQSRLGFHPHMAPLDILFNDDGTTAWVTFHGSWDSDVPVGYKLSQIPFSNGEPTAASTSKTGYKDIMSNADVTQCYDNTCFRPVGLAWDPKGRLFMSSDETGEIYAILKRDGTPTNSPSPSGTGTGTGTGSGSAPSSSETGGSSATSFSALAVVFGILAFVL